MDLYMAIWIIGWNVIFLCLGYMLGKTIYNKEVKRDGN